MFSVVNHTKVVPSPTPFPGDVDDMPLVFHPLINFVLSPFHRFDAFSGNFPISINLRLGGCPTLSHRSQPIRQRITHGQQEKPSASYAYGRLNYGLVIFYTGCCQSEYLWMKSNYIHARQGIYKSSEMDGRDVHRRRLQNIPDD